VDIIGGIVNKIASRKLAVTAATDAIELTWPMAVVACCYVLSQAAVDTWGS